MSLIIKIKRDLKLTLDANNPVLKSFELCIDRDRKELKLGDGVKPWKELKNLLEV